MSSDNFSDIDGEEFAPIVTKNVTSQLTEKQQRYVSNMILGMGTTKAARDAGYSHPEQQGYHLARIPHVAIAIRNAVLLRLSTEGATVGLNTLLKIANNEKAPASARVSAAKELLDRAGFAVKTLTNQGNSENKRPEDMTIEELEHAFASGKRLMEEMRNKLAIEGEVIPDSAQNTAQPETKPPEDQ